MDNREFFWGAATSAYQIEGAFNEDGKGESIWDRFASDSKNIKDGKDGTVACDSYHEYKKDIVLLKELGVNAYRFSISWTRIFPDGKEEINQKGLDFYSEFVDELLANHITPFVTLYHWDMPQPLLEEGGFYNPEIADHFAYYAEAVVKRLGDRVKHWITVNEPECVLGCGYSEGIHAPGYKETDKKKILLAVHNLLKMHGRGVKAIRENCSDAKVGLAGTDRGFVPEDKNDPQLLEQCRKHFFSINPERPLFSSVIFYDPIFLGDYPQEYYSLFKDDLPDITDKDRKLIGQKLDFIAENNYSSDYCTLEKPSYFATDNERVFKVQDGSLLPKGDISWEQIVPEGIYYCVKFLTERYNLPIIISENGMCDNTAPSFDRQVHDYRRSGYIKAYVDALMKAKEEGMDVRGYFYWSLLDNFEWAEGYTKRFGLVYLDFPKTLRVKKESFQTYKNLIKSYTPQD